MMPKNMSLLYKCWNLDSSITKSKQDSNDVSMYKRMQFNAIQHIYNAAHYSHHTHDT